jgi:hypothetical protein
MQIAKCENAVRRPLSPGLRGDEARDQESFDRRFVCDALSASFV